MTSAAPMKNCLLCGTASGSDRMLAFNHHYFERTSAADEKLLAMRNRERKRPDAGFQPGSFV
jgi:hypothetical protein